MKKITVFELKEKIDKKEDFQLIDVREAYEYEIVNIGGDLIPMSEIIENKHKISVNKPVIIHCKSGKRSASVIEYFEQHFKYSNLYNLEGGIIAYINEIDNSLTVY